MQRHEELPVINETTNRDGCGPILAKGPDSARSLRQRIFESVRAAGNAPRVQIAKGLGISPATVTTLTSDLIESGLLQEVSDTRDTSDPGRGRPPVALGVRGRAHYVAGLKLSDREHTAVVADFSGTIIAETSFENAGNARDLDNLLDITQTLLSLVCAEAGLQVSDISAVGIGLPGFISNLEGHVYWSSLLSERNVDLARAASNRLHLPVFIDNDANLVALAELWFGRGRELSNFAVVTIEYGVGMGLVLNHELYRGSNELGMELGHTKVHLDGALCRCGQRGCLEAYVADYALSREATTALNWTYKDARSMQVLLESLFDHAKAGNTAARSI